MHKSEPVDHPTVPAIRAQFILFVSFFAQPFCEARTINPIGEVWLFAPRSALTAFSIRAVNQPFHIDGTLA
jgi:hypothetical protein